jgi:periplasmic divalent cation tolerance protein
MEVARDGEVAKSSVMGIETVMVGWTTTPDRATAEVIARTLVEAHLVACAQISGPISSIYRWEGKVESTEEFRLTVKFLASRASEIEACLTARHPYETPQWVFCPAAGGSEKYLNWVMGGST